LRENELLPGDKKSIIQPNGLIYGHSECRYLDETLPVLTKVLALDIIERRDREAVLKHPNTGWKLIVHEGGRAAKDKPERNHYGVRVATNNEVDNAYRYLLANKQTLGLKKVVKRKERAGSYSMFFVEPGGNYWEIESYEKSAESRIARRDCLSLENEAYGRKAPRLRLYSASADPWNHRMHEPRCVDQIL
jgi:hypothetical protein